MDKSLFLCHESAVWYLTALQTHGQNALDSNHKGLEIKIKLKHFFEYQFRKGIGDDVFNKLRLVVIARIYDRLNSFPLSSKESKRIRNKKFPGRI